MAGVFFKGPCGLLVTVPLTSAVEQTQPQTMQREWRGCFQSSFIYKLRQPRLQGDTCSEGWSLRSGKGQGTGKGHRLCYEKAVTSHGLVSQGPTLSGDLPVVVVGGGSVHPEICTQCRLHKCTQVFSVMYTQPFFWGEGSQLSLNDLRILTPRRKEPLCDAKQPPFNREDPQDMGPSMRGGRADGAHSYWKVCISSLPGASRHHTFSKWLQQWYVIPGPSCHQSCRMLPSQPTE